MGVACSSFKGSVQIHAVGGQCQCNNVAAATTAVVSITPELYMLLRVTSAFAVHVSAESDAEQQQQQSARKRIISFYEAELPPELPLPEGAYKGQEQQQQLEQLKVGCSGQHITHVHVRCSSTSNRKFCSADG
jgi:hypothetical protein